MPSPGPIITLTTDFGEGSPYVAQMKGVILGLLPHVTLVDVTHRVPPQDVTSAAWTLPAIVASFPQHAIHVVVVDPGVGTDREILCMRTAAGTLIAPDNGLLTLVAADWPPQTVVSVRNPRWWRSPVSATFHGRDIMAPVAAHVASGTPIEALGDAVSAFARVDVPAVSVAEHRITGRIVFIDSFGNAQSNIGIKHLPPGIPPEKLRLQCGSHRLTGLLRTYGESTPGTLIAVVGSGGHLEFAIVAGSAAREAGIGTGQAVTVEW